MIKIFRSLREGTVSEKKFARYLIYAMGEIILVVVGILIALQVNNWNEDSKEKTRAQAMIGNLRNELIQDSIYFSNVYNAEKELFLKSARILFNEHIKEEMSVDYDTLTGMAFRIACFTPIIKSSRNAYNELISSNLLNKIESDEFKQNLQDYYGQVDFLNNYSLQAEQLGNDLIFELAQYYKVIPPTEFSREISNFSGAGEDNFTATYDLKAFRANASLNPKLYDMIDIHRDRLGGMEIILHLSKKIISEIENLKEN